MGGLAAAPLGAAAGLTIAYGIARLDGHVGARGLQGDAGGVYGIVSGLIARFWIGSEFVCWFVKRNLGLRSVIAGCATGVFQRRGISNYAGERGAWALFYVDMPLAPVGGIAGYLEAGQWQAEGFLWSMACLVIVGRVKR